MSKANLLLKDPLSGGCKIHNKLLPFVSLVVPRSHDVSPFSSSKAEKGLSKGISRKKNKKPTK